MLVIENGRLFDPVSNTDSIKDLVIDEGRFAASATPDEKAQWIDAAGCVIVPGIMDHHCHLQPLAKVGISAEGACFSAGVTSAIDAGSCGAHNFAEYYAHAKTMRLDVRAYLHVSSDGLMSLPVLEDVDPAHWDVPAIKNCFAEYGDVLMGLKLRTSKSIVGEAGYKPLHKMMELAEEIGVPVMVHCTDPPGEMDELADALRQGDVLTHMYMNQGSTILDGNGRVKKSILRARERGVLFEAADARAHFGLDVARTAIAEGFYPDIIATDLTEFSMYQRPTAFNMAMQISKYTALGIPFGDVIKACTVTPMRISGRKADAFFTEDAPCELAVFRKEAVRNVFGDRPPGTKEQLCFTGDYVYRPVLTIINGLMVYRDITF